MNNGTWTAEFSVSHTGSLCYIPMRVSEKQRFAWLDRAGKLLGTMGMPSGVIGSFDLTPDEKRLVSESDPPGPAHCVFA
jgi:hypothetical protein